MYYVMRASAPSLHRESTDSLTNRTLPSVSQHGMVTMVITSQLHNNDVINKSSDQV